MVKYFAHISSDNPVGNVQENVGVQVYGDGTGSIITLSLDQPPLSIDFKNNFPIDALVFITVPNAQNEAVQIPGTVVLNAAKRTATVTASQPFPAFDIYVGSTSSIGITFLWEG